MKNLLIVSVFIFLFSSLAKAQDSSRYYEFHGNLGATNIGANVMNSIGRNFDLPNMGVATSIGGVSFSFGKKKYSIEMGFTEVV